MKRLFLTVLILAMTSLIASCTESQRQGYSHWKSDLIGLKRTITLYSADGKAIKTWSGRYKVEVENGTARFMHDGKAIYISGTFIIEEE
ncbi:MAG: hypothetical protein HY912_03750 [Desulfomonile tiedjei]|uniref:Uncharacterized protein n=1 Tax=Desulfomonile tiedjei TaxID=2358 RepID=A0A9D6UY67_9BACT|nr:hypothetical protein [Desulfomonile tiedjei]